MGRIAVIALLIAVCFGPSVVNADGIRAKHRGHSARGCVSSGRIYGEGEFCTLACRFASCITQTCHRGRWVIPPATCSADFGCSQSC